MARYSRFGPTSVGQVDPQSFDLLHRFKYTRVTDCNIHIFKTSGGWIPIMSRCAIHTSVDCERNATVIPSVCRVSSWRSTFWLICAVLASRGQRIPFQGFWFDQSRPSTPCSFYKKKIYKIIIIFESKAKSLASSKERLKRTKGKYRNVTISLTCNRAIFLQRDVTKKSEGEGRREWTANVYLDVSLLALCTFVLLIFRNATSLARV